MEEATQSQSLFLSSSSQQYMKAGSHKGEPDNNCSAGNDESTHGINSSSCCMPVLLLDEGRKTMMLSVITCLPVLIFVLNALLTSLPMSF
jgi:hypothetical protein